MNAEWETIGALVADAARQRGDRFAVEVVGRSLTYRALDELSDRVAAGLASLGVGAGDRVASYAFNCIEQLLVWFGTVKIGAIWVPINVGLVGDDLAYTINDAAPKVLVADGETCGNVDAVAAQLTAPCRRFVIGESDPDAGFDRLLREPGPVPAVPVRGSDPAVIIYTGGTTGLPKGVVLPHFAWICAGYRYREAFEVGPEDRHYSVLALFHVGGLMLGTIGPLVAGIPAFVDRWFSASNYWRRVRETRATIIDPIGTMVTLLCQQPPGPADRDHSVRVSLGVLGQVPAGVGQEFVSRFGVKLVNVYSLTESGGILIVHNKVDSPRPEANGKPWGWCEVQIVNERDEALPPRAIGEIVVRPTRPYTFMLRYHGSPERTLECFRNLWLHTGDLGYLDEDGYLYFTGRQAHWLRSRGENISAYEVENILSRYPGVREVIVVGVPAPLGEEDVKAFIVPEAGTALDPVAIVEWCGARMAAFKVPRYIEFVDDFPRSTTKREVERHKLRAMANDRAWDGEKVLGRRSVRPRGSGGRA